MNTPTQNRASAQKDYDYSNAGLPRDFDIRIEVAEQKEILQQSSSCFLPVSGIASNTTFKFRNRNT